MTDAHTAGGSAPPHIDVGTRLGAYEILARIGAGGMGEVYLAHDTRLGRRLALKVVPPSLAGDGDRRRRLEREAQAAARLNHPNIVTLFSFEETDGLSFLTMEYVEGEPLTSHIPGTGMHLDRLLPVAIAIADAVAAAHRAGIVHRDLKPANVMLTASGARTKVLDFGLARLHGMVVDGATATGTAPITDVGHIVGTVAYMSPEQAEGRETDARSDIFALGVMLFEMATGRRPFTGDSSISVITSILRDTPPAVSDLKPGLPVEFARIVRRCLQKEPDRRYQTAVDLRNALEEVKQESEVGISASAVAQVTRVGTRHRWMPIGAAAAAVLLAAVGVWAVKSRATADTPTPKIEIRERQVTSNPIEAPVFFAAISSDGRYVAYSDIHGLHIRFVDTGETRTVPVPPEFCFT
jgi:serine/threonine protein kinase